MLATSANAGAEFASIQGSVVLEEDDMPLLAAGGLALHVEPGGDAQSDGQSLWSAALVADTPVLRLPVYAAPRPVGDMRAAQPALDFGNTPSATRTLKLEGSALAYTETPTTTRPLVSVLELHARSPQAPASETLPTPPEVDIKYIGIGSDYLAVANKADARIFFALATWAPWSTPNALRVEFSVDTNGDGTADYRVYNTTLQTAIGFSRYGDSFVAVVEGRDGLVTTGSPINVLSPGVVQTSPFNSDVMVFSVPAKALGLSATAPAFAARVETSPTFFNTPVRGDTVEGLYYNMALPGLNLTNGQAQSPIFTDAPATQIKVGFNLVAYAQSSARGILLLHHHNGGRARAETVDVDYRWPTVITFPIVANN